VFYRQSPRGRGKRKVAQKRGKLNTDNNKMAEETCKQNSQYDQNDLPELLNQYYKRVFPYKLYYQWLSYGEGKKSKK
jgi:hypothetical protein